MKSTLISHQLCFILNQMLHGSLQLNYSLLVYITHPFRECANPYGSTLHIFLSPIRNLPHACCYIMFLFSLSFILVRFLVLSQVNVRSFSFYSSIDWELYMCVLTMKSIFVSKIGFLIYM